MKRQRPEASCSHHKYRCLWCLTPSEALFRNLAEKRDRHGDAAKAGGGGGGGSDNLQLTTCPTCRETVDPYCEREWLLVVMDMVLIRPEAYRHALLNRIHWSTTPRGESKGDDSFATIRGAAFLMVLSSLCSAISIPTTALDQPPEAFVSIGFMFGLALVKQVVLYSLVWTFCRWMFGGYAGVVPSGSLALALLLPELGWRAATLLVGVWESTITVRLLGSVLSVTCQFMSLLSLFDDASARRSRSFDGLTSSWGPGDHSWAVTILIMSASLLSRTVLMELVLSCLPPSYALALPRMCSGIQLSPLLVTATSAVSDTSFEKWLDVCWT